MTRGITPIKQRRFLSVAEKIQVESPCSLSVNERLDVKAKRGAHAGYVFPIDLL